MIEAKFKKKKRKTTWLGSQKDHILIKTPNIDPTNTVGNCHDVLLKTPGFIKQEVQWSHLNVTPPPSPPPSNKKVTYT